MGLMMDQRQMPRCNTRYIDRIDREVGTGPSFGYRKDLI
jgi:hypothetical protein